MTRLPPNLPPTTAATLQSDIAADVAGRLTADIREIYISRGLAVPTQNEIRSAIAAHLRGMGAHMDDPDKLRDFYMGLRQELRRNPQQKPAWAADALNMFRSRAQAANAFGRAQDGVNAINNAIGNIPVPGLPNIPNLQQILAPLAPLFAPGERVSQVETPQTPTVNTPGNTTREA